MSVKGKKLGKKATKVPRAKKRKLKDVQNSSEEDEWPCLVCGESFSRSRPGEKWVKCMTSDRWAHVDCTTRSRYYVCMFATIVIRTE